jgi:hypothetical protein
MGWIYKRLVGKRHEPVVQRVVQVCSEILGRPTERYPQVGAADVSDKQSVSGENSVWFCRVLLEIEHQDRNGLDRMAGRLQNFEAHSWEIKSIAIPHPHKCVFRLGVGTEMDRGTATVAQFQMPGDEVSVKMGEEYVPYSRPDFSASARYRWISRWGSTMMAVELALSPSR